MLHLYNDAKHKLGVRSITLGYLIFIAHLKHRRSVLYQVGEMVWSYVSIYFVAFSAVVLSGTLCLFYK